MKFSECASYRVAVIQIWFHNNKNQKYIYDLASKLLDVAGLSIEFHFVGNECYKDDCGIENIDLPNCTIWGERDDVDRFYSSVCMVDDVTPQL